jgi:2-C-methyl-D-erythritol 4-phosphate cytidylyltransferase
MSFPGNFDERSDYLVVTAAGFGQRFGCPKFNIPIQNQPMILKTLSAFALNAPFFSQCLITISKEHEADLQILLKAQQFPWPIQIVYGGKTRAISVKNAVDQIGDASFIWIHDAARPFVSSDLIQRLFDQSRYHDGVVPVIDVVDTLKQVKDHYVLKTLDRSDVKAVQTPQVFKSSVLKRAYLTDFYDEQTDEAGLIERQGGRIYTLVGDRKNIKITFKTDLDNII